MSFVCLRQRDIKVLIAYSSVAHMSFAIACFVSKTGLGYKSAILILIAHGVSSPLLFLLAGGLYGESNSRQMALNAGLLRRAPRVSAMWFFAAAANMGTPPLINF